MFPTLPPELEGEFDVPAAPDELLCPDKLPPVDGDDDEPDAPGGIGAPSLRFMSVADEGDVEPGAPFIGAFISEELPLMLEVPDVPDELGVSDAPLEG